MSQETDRKLADLVVWYEYHRDQPKDMDRLIEFMKKTIDCILEVQAMILKDIQVLEKREGTPKLLVPSRIRLHDKIHV